MAEQAQGGRADRDQIRHTLTDVDLSEDWLRTKVQQLLDTADDLAQQLEQAAQRELQALIAFYYSDRRACAHYCDEERDTSGVLLGRVRDAVTPATQETVVREDSDE